MEVYDDSTCKPWGRATEVQSFATSCVRFTRTVLISYYASHGPQDPKKGRISVSVRARLSFDAGGRG